jgi:succinate dehydrogenase hydrophobic anchor subunit
MLAGLKRTWDITLKESFRSGKLNLAVTGVMLMAFMFIHLLQFRFGETKDYFVRPPPLLIYFSGILKLQLFWTDDETIPPVAVRDIYKLEYDRFTTGPLFPQFWAVYYIISTVIFVIHGCLGWIKLVEQRLNIPKGHHWRVKIIGYLIFVALGLVYLSFPAYCMSLDALECGKTCTNGAVLNNKTFTNQTSGYSHCSSCE